MRTLFREKLRNRHWVSEFLETSSPLDSEFRLSQAFPRMLMRFRITCVMEEPIKWCIYYIHVCMYMSHRARNLHAQDFPPIENIFNIGLIIRAQVIILFFYMPYICLCCLQKSRELVRLKSAKGSKKRKGRDYNKSFAARKFVSQKYCLVHRQHTWLMYTPGRGSIISLCIQCRYMPAINRFLPNYGDL